MTHEQAVRLIRDTFEKPFERDRFRTFTKNLLNHVEDTPQTVYRGNLIPDAFEPYVRSMERVGKYEDSAGSKLDVLVVHLKRETSLVHARTTQRNFIAWYLNGSRGGKLKDAALVAFVSPGEDDWRFSLVKMEYALAPKSGARVKVNRVLTPARRYSFLVGPNEGSHTAQAQLVSLLGDDRTDPTLAQLEAAFGIERVTKEFFGEYRDLFLRVKDALDEVLRNSPNVKQDFAVKGISPVDFAKKLLGQLVFLYFLQKKGWFGVARDAEWGTGPKDFLRSLFRRGDYDSFFNDVLEPLFYEALARERDDDFYSRFNCKIPFLNGGLFDPVGKYDWIHADILLPDAVFSNDVRTEAGDTGTGVLDVFDRYNFTVNEDEPLEKEVAIDPEFLGKVFEKFNAITDANYREYREALVSERTDLERKFNKKYGVYYTPRPIVHYICQQTLTDYLATRTEGKVRREDIETLVRLGETAAEHEAHVHGRGKETEHYPFVLPRDIRDHARDLDVALADVRVCDPAVGSGAFPVGMMLEIVRARFALGSVLNDGRTTYTLKRHAIQNSLYGVDIDPGAVEIARLRLWLSMVVDEQERRRIKPLPNLDYKIMQGDSLVSEFLSVDLDDLGEDRNTLADTGIPSELVAEFRTRKDQFLAAARTEDKERLRNEVEELVVQMFEAAFRHRQAGYFAQLRAIEERYSAVRSPIERQRVIAEEKARFYKKARFNIEDAERRLREYSEKRLARPFFPWRLYFAEVFAPETRATTFDGRLTLGYDLKGQMDMVAPPPRPSGFDIVIGNPPYGLLNKRQNKGESVVVSTELLEYFRHSPSYAASQGGMLNIYRLFVLRSIQLLSASGEFCEIFPLAFAGDTSAAGLRRYILESCGIRAIEAFPERDNEAKRVFEPVKMSVCILRLCRRFDPERGFHLRIHWDRFVDEMNPAVALDVETLRLLDRKNMAVPLVLPSELDLLLKVFRGSRRLADVGHCFTGEVDLTFDKAYISRNPRDAVLLRGAAVGRYVIKSSMSQGEFLYLKSDEYRKAKGEKKMSHQLRQRIVLQGITGVNERVRLKLTLLSAGTYCANSVNYIALQNRAADPLFMLGLLNSRLLNYVFMKFSTNSNVNGYEVDNLPIPSDVPREVERRVAALASSVLDSKQQETDIDTSTAEGEIDRLIYDLYGLTEAEVAIVEGQAT